MSKAKIVNVTTHVIGIDRAHKAEQLADQPDPGVSVDGLVFGVAKMSENAPHGGEMHADGDEVLYLVSGKARLVFLDDKDAEVDLESGGSVIVPQGQWHRVDVLEPCHIVYLTPGTGNQVRPLAPPASINR